MKLIKPSWVIHEDGKEQKGRKLPIYTIHVHPDGVRLATGGLDAKIRIWSTLPILSPEIEANEANPRLLCTMSQHDGSVLCVRWAHHGRYLASGSDDNVVVIWDLDPRGGGTVFGSTDINIETWKPLQRLVGHSSDIVDLAWSKDDTQLATVGLDSMVYVWDMATFSMVTKIAQHEGFVKGVCWDPVGEYLATQSDDKSVKIWRTSDWSLERTVTEPFRSSPGSTFFRRLSWSPDGAFIASSNAMNKAVFTAAIIQRHGWKQDVSFVGHENTVEVTAFNPRTFLPPGAKISRAKMSSMVALGSDDRNISVWLNNRQAPLVVIKEVFDGQIYDLTWSQQGLTLYGCSHDGSIVCLDFTESELPSFAEEGALEKILNTYEHYAKKPKPLRRPSNARPTALAPTLTFSQLVARSSSASLSANANPIPSTKPVPIPEPTPQNISLTRKGKKRIQPSFMGNADGSSSSSSAFGVGTSAQAPANAFYRPPPQHQQPDASSSFVPKPSPLGQNSSSSQPRRVPLTTQPLNFPLSQASSFSNANNANIDTDVEMSETGSQPSWSVDSPAQLQRLSANGMGKKRAFDERDGGRDEAATRAVPTRVKARTLGGGGGGSSGGAGPVVELRAGGSGEAIVAAAFTGSSGNVLQALPVKSYLKATIDDSSNSDWVEAKNSLNSPTTITYHSASSGVDWLDFLPSPLVALGVTSTFSAFACEDGTLHVYSPTGRKLLPTMKLDGPVAMLDVAEGGNVGGKGSSGSVGSGGALAVVTTKGTMGSWNIKRKTSSLPVSTPPNISILLSPSTTIIQTLLRPNNAHLFLLSSGQAYTYSPSLSSFILLSSSWHAHGSSAWEAGSSRRSSTLSSRGLIATIENGINEQGHPSPPGLGEQEGGGGGEEKEWWEQAMTLSHLETRMLACLVLETTGQEYKMFLGLYAKKLGEEGFRSKAEELVRELAGKMVVGYPSLSAHHPNRQTSSTDSSSSNTILGLLRRDLLREVLSIYVKSRTLVKLGQDWQETIRRIVALEKEMED